MWRRLIIGAVMLVVSAAPAAAQESGERSQALTRLVDCRKLSDAAARLSCYDREVAAFDAAASRKDVVVVDREQLRKTRRTLFGLTLPNLSVFGDDSPDEEGIQTIDSTIKSLAQTGLGKWVITLADGAVWEQIDSRDLPIEPRAGHPIKIRRAAMGSYLANIKSQTAIRVKRMR